jgi:hypothetical protein
LSRTRTRTPAEAYRHFAEVDAAGRSPLYERVTIALRESDEALRAIELRRTPGIPR